MNFDIDQLDTQDTASMTVFANGEPTNWVWVFAGPGHQRTIDLANQFAREQLHRTRQQEQAQVNRKKWRAEEETPADLMKKNIQMILARLLDWHVVDEAGKRTDEQIQMNGKPYLFSPENAQKLLADPRKGTLLLQAIEFLGDERSFTQRSAINSSGLQSENLNSPEQTTD